MVLEPRGQLTCSDCLRSIVLSDVWLKSASGASGHELTGADLHRLCCKSCGTHYPDYMPPIDWAMGSGHAQNIDHYLSMDIEERESPYDFYYEQLAEDGGRPDDD